jgi:hypothetical protein
MLLDGTEPQQMLDNIAVHVDGNLILQEDSGNQAYLARTWKFNPRSAEPPSQCNVSGSRWAFRPAFGI